MLFYEYDYDEETGEMKDDLEAIPINEEDEQEQEQEQEQKQDSQEVQEVQEGISGKDVN